MNDLEMPPSMACMKSASLCGIIKKGKKKKPQDLRKKSEAETWATKVSAGPLQSTRAKKNNNDLKGL